MGGSGYPLKSTKRPFEVCEMKEPLLVESVIWFDPADSADAVSGGVPVHEEQRPARIDREHFQR